MSHRIMSIATLALLGTLALPQLASAQQTTYVPEGEIKQNEAEAALGKGRLDGTLGLSASFSFVDNSNVVGQVDGFSTLIGIGIVGGLDYLYGKYEMRNTMKFNAAFSRTPVLDEFVKTNDILEFENLHNYFLINWAGVFGRLQLTTNILKTESVTADPQTYQVIGQATPLETTERFELNGAFGTLSLYQSLGAFAEPIKSTPLSLSIRFGAGARETFTDGVFVVSDNADTANILELQELQNVYQGGLEGFVGIRGTFDEKRVSYNAGLSAMIPFLNNDEQDRGAAELTRIAAEAAVNVGVFTWMNVVYNLKVIQDPQLLDETQVQNNLLLSFQYTLIDRSTAKPTDAAEIEKAKAAAAEDKAAAAEQKAKVAEDAAKAAEEKAEAAEAKAKAAEEKAEAEKKANEEKKPEEGDPKPENPTPEQPNDGTTPDGGTTP